MIRQILKWFLILGMTTTYALAQPIDCSDGVVHDDGDFENGFGSTSAFFGHFVMRVDPQTLPAKIESVCVCWQRANPTDSTIAFDILVWDSDGPDGAPGSFLGSFEGALATGVPFGLDGAFYRFDLSSLNIITPRPVYIGPLWDSGLNEDFFVCSDESGATVQPAYFENGLFAGILPPATSIADLDADYRALGIRAVFSEANAGLTDRGGLILPGFEAEVGTTDGPTTFFSVRNTSDDDLILQVDYFGNSVAGDPVRTDQFILNDQATLPVDVRQNLEDLPVEDGFARGLVILTESGDPDSPNLEGDYFRVDFSGDFAAGDRLVKSEDLCQAQEVRYVDFGSGSELRILLDRTPADETAAFSYVTYNEAGEMVGSGEYFTDDNLVLLDIMELVPGEAFGTILFDFTNSGSGWVSGKYTAFGRFSLELNGVCVAPPVGSAEASLAILRHSSSDLPAKLTQRMAESATSIQ